MRIFVRLDASPLIGLGHAMRCLTLVSALRSQGGSVVFVCKRMTPPMASLIRQAGHALLLLDEEASLESSARDNASLDPEDDACATVAALRGERCDWLIVDHYGLGARWEGRVRSAVDRIMVIDDMADRDHDCDVLLDQNLFADAAARYQHRVASRTRLLLGPQYALLRDEFRRVRERAAPRDGEIQRVFVMYGGTDPLNLTGRTLDALCALPNYGLRVDVVIGASHPERDAIQRRCSQEGYSCHVDSNEIAALMSQADLAFGAGGSATWERCCVGLPAICISFAENQRPIAAAVEEAGAAMFLGDEAQADASAMIDAFLVLSRSPARVRDMSSQAYALVDGRGTQRVSQALRESA